MDRGAWQATVHGVAMSQTRLSDKHFHLEVKEFQGLPETTRNWEKSKEGNISQSPLEGTNFGNILTSSLHDCDRINFFFSATQFVITSQ